MGLVQTLGFVLVSLVNILFPPKLTLLDSIVCNFNVDVG